MLTADLLLHLLRALRRAFWRIVGWFLVVGLIGVVVVELVSIFVTGGHLPTMETHLAAAAVGLAIGYAAAVTVLLGEVLRGLLDAVGAVERDVREGLTAGADLTRVAERGLRELEHRL